MRKSARSKFFDNRFKTGRYKRYSDFTKDPNLVVEDFEGRRVVMSGSLPALVLDINVLTLPAWSFIGYRIKR